jgi:hypothetical protein
VRPVRFTKPRQQCLRTDLAIRYKVVSWSIVLEPATKRMVYDITFQRLFSESSMDAVLERPWTVEVEDYARYKRLKRDAREKRQEATQKIIETRPGFIVSGSDGTADDQSWRHDRSDTMWEVCEDQISESPKGSVVVSRTSKKSAVSRTRAATHQLT